MTIADVTIGNEGLARPELSIAIPCLNEEENVENIYSAVTREAEIHARSHEIIFIDNCSTDRTRDLIREICARDPRVRAIFNNRNYGQMRSPTYAIYQADGDAVIGMGADFQDPPALIGALVDHWRKGAQVVLGQRRIEKASWPIRLGRALGYGFLGRYADYPVIPGATGFGLFSREVVDTLAAWHEPEPFFRGMVVEGGFRIAVVPFDRPERAAGETKNGFRTLVDFALSGLAGSAKGLLRAPMLWSVYVGLATAMLGAATLITAWLGNPISTLLIVTVLFAMFGVQLLCLGLIGEQVRMISERTRNVPLVIEEERLNFPKGRKTPSSRTIVQLPPSSA